MLSALAVHTKIVLEKGSSTVTRRSPRVVGLHRLGDAPSSNLSTVQGVSSES